jgi:26S proteasome regulatory subunit N13
MNPQLAALLQQAQASGPKPLIEVKAGKMNYDGRMVKPDRRRGIIRIMKDPQGLLSFQLVDADNTS